MTSETNSNELKEKIQEATTTPLIESAKVTAERLEKANAELRSLLDRQEKIETRRFLGGGSEAGSVMQKPVDPQEQIKQEAKSFFRGTEIERYLS